MQQKNDDIPLKVGKLISYNFLTVLISKDSLTQLGDFYPNVESRKLAREWFALQVFLMVIAISSHFKDNPIGIKVAQYFRMYIIEGLSEAGVYGSEDEATLFVKSRLDVYDMESSKKGENYLMNVSIQFLKFVDQQDGLLLVNTGEQVSTFLQTNKKLIEEAEKLAKKNH